MSKTKDLPELPAGFAYMVARNHSFVLHGGVHTLRFTPGKMVSVHHTLQARARAHGAEMLDGEAEVTKNPKPDPQKDPSSVEYHAAVRVAAEALLAKNDPEDFGANGKPYIKAWEREIGWKPDEGIREKIWDEAKTEFMRL